MNDIVLKTIYSLVCSVCCSFYTAYRPVVGPNVCLRFFLFMRSNSSKLGSEEGAVEVAMVAAASGALG